MARVNLDLDPSTGAILRRIDFAQRHWIDRAVGIGVAANQLFGLFTALGLNILNVSAVAMWWGRRPRGLLGAPAALRQAPVSNLILLPLVILSVRLPLFGATAILVVVLERFVLRNIPAASRWLGLSASLATA